jgi:hypothetical protein
MAGARGGRWVLSCSTMCLRGKALKANAHPQISLSPPTLQQTMNATLPLSSRVFL